MREIFLEEAPRCSTTPATRWLELQARHDDTVAMTTVRRAFHTLKGSARMVGLRDFGEAAWACEQLYNSPPGQPPRSCPLCWNLSLKRLSRQPRSSLRWRLSPRWWNLSPRRDRRVLLKKLRLA
jgi:chemosensory pili system protein ChpA (sensor histidine kinase/response regulator)